MWTMWFCRYCFGWKMWKMWKGPPVWVVRVRAKNLDRVVSVWCLCPTSRVTKVVARGNGSSMLQHRAFEEICGVTKCCQWSMTQKMEDIWRYSGCHMSTQRFFVVRRWDLRWNSEILMCWFCALLDVVLHRFDEFSWMFQSESWIIIFQPITVNQNHKDWQADSTQRDRQLQYHICLLRALKFVLIFCRCWTAPVSPRLDSLALVPEWTWPFREDFPKAKMMWNETFRPKGFFYFFRIKNRHVMYLFRFSFFGMMAKQAPHGALHLHVNVVSWFRGKTAQCETGGIGGIQFWSGTSEQLCHGCFRVLKNRKCNEGLKCKSPTQLATTWCAAHRWLYIFSGIPEQHTFHIPQYGWNLF